MNEVWRAFMGDFQSADIAARIGNALSQSELNRLHGLNRKQRRKQYLLSRAMIRVALSETFDLPLTHWKMLESRDAPPSVTNPVDQPLYLSLSHSADCIMLAISERVVGLDVEHMQANRPYAQIAQRVFTPEQQKTLTSLNQTERMMYFYQLWTAKEALVKIADPRTTDSMFSTAPWLSHPYLNNHACFDEFYVSLLSPLDIQAFTSYDLISFEEYEKNSLFCKNQQH